ncbi:MAG: RluA family pseudouridine synthase [Cucumibacter sp.]
MSGVQQRAVARDEVGMRLDRWFAVNFPGLPHSHLQKLIRSGQVRVDSARAKPDTRLERGQIVRIPPITLARAAPNAAPRAGEAEFLRSILIHESQDILVFNKPAGLAVQGGSGTARHLDGMLAALTDKKGEAPKLVHRLDRDTSGCLLVARNRATAAHFSKVFRTRSARKIYWAVTAGVPAPPQGRISCFLVRQGTADGEQMRVVAQGVEGAQHSLSHYSVIDRAGDRFAWVSLKPVTGRTHQLRVHMAELKSPILGDPRYFNLKGFEAPAGLGEGLHLHARRLALPLPGGARLDISAPLPAHMARTFDTLGFDAARYDAQSADPEEAT